MKRWPLAYVMILWPLAFIMLDQAEARPTDREYWAHRYKQLCCLVEGPHWRLVDKRKCYTDKWRARNELRWCLQGEARTQPSEAEILRRGLIPHPDGGPPSMRSAIEDAGAEAPPPPPFDPTSTLRAQSDLRRIEILKTVPRPVLEDLGGPHWPVTQTTQPVASEPPAHPTEPTPEGNQVSPGAPFSPYGSLFVLLLVALMLGNALTEDQ